MILADTRQKVLIADDEHLNRKVLSDLLGDQYMVILAKNAEQAMEKAYHHQPDLILLDVVMPDRNGFDVLRELKQMPDTQNIPVIFISALDSEDDEEKGLLLGACDYIAKPFRQSLVKARIDIHMQMASQRKLLEELANLDGLTNVANRRCFERHLQDEWKRAQRTQQPLSILLLDIDHFKLYNDNYGHGGGDHVLKKVAKTLQQRLRRPADIVARYGGEEFVVMLPDTDADGGRCLAEGLLTQVERLEIHHGFSPTCPRISISVGGVTTVPNSMDNMRALLDQADTALYEAKRQGRNRAIWHDS